MSVHLSLLSIIIISHVQYASIITILVFRLVLFNNGAWIVLGSNTINENSISLAHCCRATTSHKCTMIVESLLWPIFFYKIIREVHPVTDVHLVRCCLLLACYWLPSILDTRRDYNSMALSFFLRNHFLVLRFCFLLM